MISAVILVVSGVLGIVEQKQLAWVGVLLAGFLAILSGLGLLPL